MNEMTRPQGVSCNFRFADLVLYKTRFVCLVFLVCGIILANNVSFYLIVYPDILLFAGPKHMVLVVLKYIVKFIRLFKMCKTSYYKSNIY